MDIGKRLYQDLAPKHRAIAIYAAVNRDDQAEMDRLTGNTSKDRKYGQAFLGLGQALETYNLFVSQAMNRFLLANGQLMAAASFCVGWLSAGGAQDHEEYQQNCLVSKKMATVTENLAGEIGEVQQAAREWCARNQIPVDFFSGQLCALKLPKEMTEKSNSETLNAVRSVFEKITLEW